MGQSLSDAAPAAAEQPAPQEEKQPSQEEIKARFDEWARLEQLDRQLRIPLMDAREESSYGFKSRRKKDFTLNI